MTVLLDTHVLLWALAEPEKLNEQRRAILEDGSNACFVSSVSAAEIAIKASIGKLEFHGDLLEMVNDTGFEWIDFTAVEAVMLRELPFHHRDPFDRMLVCQALHRDIPIMTLDANISRYSCKIV